MKKADIGLIGLAVMGENLVMNMESKGFTVAVFNRTTEKVDKFVNGRAAGKNIIGCHSLQELVDNLEKPRKVFMMVKAGQAVDDMIEQLLPLLDDGDILIDGGNSHFPDTIRRTAYVESKGKLYIGTGLGLAICKNILERCGGEIFYSKSFVLGGACFTVRFPKGKR